MLVETEDSVTNASRDYARIREAIRYLVAHAHQQPELSDLAAALHLSESHLQRLFTRWAGVSPKRFLQHLSCEAAKVRLANGESLLNSAQELGLSGSSRLHDLFITLEAMTPGEYKNGGAGLELSWSVEVSRFGLVLLARTTRGVCAIQFVDSVASAEAYLRGRWPQAVLHYQAGSEAELVNTLFEPLVKKGDQPLALRVQGTNFQLQVWRALLGIPYAAFCSYQQIAAAIGRPSAARAVGSAVGANPIAWLIPCHRVIRAEGVLGEYRWGAERKIDLIAWEQAQAVGSQ
ncbi:methylated-DNA--[protein]-cysteine S-methyltransferase [Neisseriaceae bacterium TC5R-5]|nr:methylated-DNA--[protein]-cysteine S-methyltransferase [Neisseriaceae bacterium TC5R-5]